MHPYRFPAALLTAVLAATIVGFAPVAERPVALAATGPVAEWTFDDGDGSTASDAIGSLDGTITGGATWITGDVAQGTGALEFDGVDDLVTIADSSTLRPTSVTVTAWIRLEDSSTNWMAIVAKGANGCEGASYDILSAGGSINGIVDVPAAQDWFAWASDGASLTDGAWHLVAYSYDATSGVARWSIDGRAGEVPGVPVTYDLPGGDDLTIGGIASGCNWYQPFSGAIDDVRVYDRALDAGEMDDLIADVATTTTASLPVDPVPANSNPTVMVTVSPAPSAGGLVTLYRYVDGAPVPQSLDGINPYTGRGYLALSSGPLAEGDYDVYVVFHDGGTFQDSQSATGTVEVRRRSNSVTLNADRSVAYPGQSIGLTFAATEYTTGFEVWDAHDGGSPTLVGSVASTFYSNVYNGQLTIPDPALGSHAYSVVSTENEAFLSGTSPTVTVSVTKRPTTVDVASFGSGQAGLPHDIWVGVMIGDPYPQAAPGATGTITLSDGATPIGTLPVADGGAWFTVPSFAIGTHQLIGTYSGDDSYEGSSGSINLEISANVVEATGIGVQYSTFYPYRDGYRDTVAVRGTRQEPASVAIRIYSSTGKLVRSASIAQASGPYAYAWNGRTSSGTIRPAGKYRVVQTLTDATGTRKVVTSYTTLSMKRLYKYTKTLTKDYTQTSKKTTSWIAWSFTLPSATVYKSLSFSIYGKDGVGSGGFGPHDYGYCSSSYWYPDCATRWKTFPITFSWKSVTGSLTYDRSGRYVRLYAWGGYGATQVKYGRVKVTYAVLK